MIEQLVKWFRDRPTLSPTEHPSDTGQTESIARPTSNEHDSLATLPVPTSRAVATRQPAIWYHFYSPSIWSSYCRTDGRLVGMPYRFKHHYLAMQPGDWILIYVTDEQTWCGLLEIVTRRPTRDAMWLPQTMPLHLEVKPLIRVPFVEGVPKDAVKGRVSNYPGHANRQIEPIDPDDANILIALLTEKAKTVAPLAVPPRTTTFTPSTAQHPPCPITVALEASGGKDQNELLATVTLHIPQAPIQIGGFVVHLTATGYYWCYPNSVVSIRQKRMPIQFADRWLAWIEQAIKTAVDAQRQPRPKQPESTLSSPSTPDSRPAPHKPLQLSKASPTTAATIPNGQLPVLTPKQERLITPREYQVYTLLEAGLSKETIAAQLKISTITISVNLHRIRKKLARQHAPLQTNTPAHDTPSESDA